MMSSPVITFELPGIGSAVIGWIYIQVHCWKHLFESQDLNQIIKERK